MANVFQNTDRMWFGTRERMQWIETPRSGANVSTSGTFAEADLINGGAFVRNSVDAHKNYAFTWGDTADRRLASIIRSYRNGSYGDGPIYFSDPMYYETNLFSQRWAAPSMALREEAPTLTGDIGTLSSIPTAPNPHGLPIASAVYQFGSITNWTGEQDSAFHLEIPEGMELVVGAYYTATGGARIALRRNGFQRTELPQHSVSDETCMDTIIGPGGSVDVFLESGASPNGTLTIAGMIARLRPVGSGGEFDGQTVTNLFTNPNLLGDGTWAEVRRNHVSNTLTGALDGLSATRLTVSGGSGFSLFTISDPAAGGFQQRAGQINANARPVSPGDVVSVRLEIAESTQEHLFAARLFFQDDANGQIGSVISGSSVQVGPSSGFTEVLLEDVVVPAGATKAAWDFGLDDTTPRLTGATFKARRAQMAVNTPLGPYFDGSTTPETAVGVVQPEDFRWRWLGAENASESVMEVERVDGVATSNCIAGVSTKAGKPAIRLIPTNSLNGSFARFIIPAAARGSGTLMATQHKDAPITGSLAVYANRLRAQLPSQDSSAAPNATGRFPLRFVFSGLTSLYYAILPHGGAQDSGDVWWTDIGLFAGDYDGPWLDGARTFPVSGELGSGEWFVGEGHSGCRFLGSPAVYNNDGINGGHVSLSCDLRETGAWE